jgi:hypothetical protein
VLPQVARVRLRAAGKYLFGGDRERSAAAVQ